VREEIKWETKGDFEDGKSHLFVDQLHGVHGVYYFHRALKFGRTQGGPDVGRGRSFQSLGQWPACAGAIHKTKTEDGPAKLSVDLKQGDNKILVKAVNFQGACYFTFNADLEDADKPPANLRHSGATRTGS